ncbi:MAG: hypothetical protein OXI16_10335 [Chloroflexota bacterium]|nr:hypothetical protein [Chloroflexota bacterium]
MFLGMLIAMVMALIIVIWIFLVPRRKGEWANVLRLKKLDWLKSWVRKIVPRRKPRTSLHYRMHIVDVLRTLIIDRDGGINYLKQVVADRQGREALETLRALTAAGLVVHRGPQEGLGYYPTLAGLDFLERHENSAKVWWRNNWFPVVVAIVSSIIGAANVAVAVLSFLKSSP